MTETSSYPNAGVLRRQLMRFESDFTQLPNAWMRDRRLSFGARGLLSHLMTHAAGYQVSLASLATETWKEGRDSIRSLVSELERAGYLHRVKERSRGRFSGYGWYLQDPFEIPAPKHPELPIGAVDNSPPSSSQPTTAKPTTIEDQVKNTFSTSVSHEPLDAPVENFGRLSWDDDRCPGNWRDRTHELGPHGTCIHCHARPHSQVRAS